MTCCGMTSHERLLEDEESELRFKEVDCSTDLPNCTKFNDGKQRSLDEFKTDEGILLTGRTLFLNENLMTKAYKRFVPGTVNPEHLDTYKERSWNGESYSCLLKLSDKLLSSWNQKKILDIGGGQSFFPEEAAALGIEVTAIDLNLDKYKKIWGKILPQAREIYIENTERIFCLNTLTINKNKEEVVHKDIKLVFNNIFAKRKEIANKYPDLKRRRKMDALDLKFEDNTFDVVISVWVLVYLDEKEVKKLLEEAVRVTKEGGQIRLYGGDNCPTEKGILFSEGFLIKHYNFKSKDNSYRTIGKKNVRIDWGFSGQSLVVLHVGQAAKRWRYC